MDAVSERPILLFDGVCNLCNGAVQFIMARDKQQTFLFASLQSEYGQRFLIDNKLSTDSFDSVLLISGGRVFTMSSAAFEIGRQLGGPLILLRPFSLLPRFITDFIYQLIARNRYRLFGKRDQCRLPTPAERSRFLA